jgi:hypothetical protein
MSPRLTKTGYPQELRDVPTIRGLATVIGVHLDVWAQRDDSEPQPNVQAAGDYALDAIDALLARLHEARSELVDEINTSHAASAARWDALKRESAKRHG